MHHVIVEQSDLHRPAPPQGGDVAGRDMQILQLGGADERSQVCDGGVPTAQLEEPGAGPEQRQLREAAAAGLPQPSRWSSSSWAKPSFGPTMATTVLQPRTSRWRRPVQPPRSTRCCAPVGVTHGCAVGREGIGPRSGL